MKLTTVTVKNYRSYVANNGNGRVPTLEVGTGLNLLVGPNNCGKSNLLRAIALALDPHERQRFDAACDTPIQVSRAVPSITLHFNGDRKIGVEKTLLGLLSDYEKSAGAKKTFSQAGDIQFRVSYTNTGVREEGFLIRGAGARRGDRQKLDRALKQFKKCVRFIYLKSGESLGNFLVGTFRELLHTVLRDHLSEQMDKAEKRRQEYLDGVVDDLLQPLQTHTLRHLQDVMAELVEISIRPHSPLLDETLANSAIWLKDTADTALLNKGTGVRGALLVALLSYLAQHSKRSLVLAVEEPESFLHPGAQRELRSDLVQLAERDDLTLLVTTHSPFLIDRSPTTLITAFTKHPDGSTTISKPICGDEKLTPVIGSLFADTVMPNMIDLIEPISSTAKAVLFVEGYDDYFYLTTAAKLANRSDLLEGLEIRHDSGAYKSALQALLLRQMAGKDFPIACLFDWDTTGKEAHRLLTARYGWNGKLAVTYREWRQVNPSEAPVEAEDMFPARLMDAFVAICGNSALAETNRYQDGTFHYGLTQAGKVLFLEYINKELKVGHVGTFVKILRDLRQRLGLPVAPALSSGVSK